MLQPGKQLRDIVNERNLQKAPEKSFFMVLTVKYLDHEMRFNTKKLIHSKIAAIHKVLSPTTKSELLKFIRSMSFNSNIFDKFHVNLKLLYSLLHDNVQFH